MGERKGKGKKDKEELLLSWSFPPQGWYKLNVDGSRRHKPQCIGGGGVIRNENGEWVAGFVANFGTGKAIEAELKALHTGLELALKSRVECLEVETDSQLAVNLLSNVGTLYQEHHLIELIKSCNALLNQNSRWTISGVYRQQNCVADCLAGLGHTLEEGVTTYYDSPPTACEPILLEDQSMVARTRLISLRKLMNQNAGNILIPRSYRFKNHYVLSMKNAKVEEGDDLEPVTFTWKIDNFSKMDTASKHYSDNFVIGNSKWRILLYLKGNAVDYLSPYLDVPDVSKLPQGWSRCAHFSLTVVNQLQPSKSITKAKVELHKVKAKNLKDKRTVGSAPVEQGPDIDSVKDPDRLTTCKELNCEQMAAGHDAPSFEKNSTEPTSPSSSVEDAH
uniref:uncharacterized protein LOC101292780 isoform X2 n=1 Tax=Fragaria vesca subsp. vesca TaxID=101020 RepID=UPI0005C96E88|nr:PREDICTED: uncharacterized protein LOC101292780 isoform X2 [Fragaria vesca subsp. vesca]